MPKFKVGDSVRFTKTGFTAKVIKIGPDPEADDPNENRYFFKISADDEELVVGEGNQLFGLSMPVSRADKEGVEKIA